MKKIVLSTVVLFAMASFAAAAEPLRLTDAQMDNVTAGQPPQQEGLINVNVEDIGVVAQIPVVANVAAAILGGEAQARQRGNVTFEPVDVN